MELKDQLRIARTAGGLSIQELADVIGVTKQAIVWWENGIHHPRLPMLKKIETALKTRFNATGAKPLAGSNPDIPGISAEAMRLALAISRLRKADREAVVQLVTTLETYTLKKV